MSDSYCSMCGDEIVTEARIELTDEGFIIIVCEECDDGE